VDAGKFLEKVESRKAVVGVVGAGYVGLPLALAFSEAGFPVLALDIDPGKVKRLSAGQSYISYIPDQRIARAVEAGFRATADFSQAATVDAVLLCVPTPLAKDRKPDLSFVEGTAKSLAPHLQKGMLVCLESTTYPGTTEEVLIPILEAGSGLSAGADFFVAYSPEREDPQNKEYGVSNIPKLVGGLDEASKKAASGLYGAIVERTVPVGSMAVAEAAKIFENVFRAVNIALVNEMKTILDKMGIDVWEVIEAASTKPFGFMPFHPGPGLGGHCIPIDPFYLAWKANEHGVPTRFIELAGEINARMPEYVVERLARALEERGQKMDGARVLVLGVAYKKNVEDLRESASLRIIRLLSERGASADYHDPHVPVITKTREYPELAGKKSVPFDAVGSYDAVIIATAHDAVDHEAVARVAKLVVDTRNAIRQRDLSNVVRA